MRSVRFAFMFCMLLGTRAAFGQAQPVEDVRKNAKIHAGPVYLTPLLQLKDFGVDSNVFNAAGEQKSDFMTNVSATVNLWVPAARRALLSTTAATDLVWYATYDSERSIDPQLTVRGEGYLHRLTIFAQNAYLNTRQRPNYEIDLRSRHLENDALAGIGLQLTPRFSIEAAGRRLDTRYDADARFDGTYLQRTLNRKTTGGELTARHMVTPLTTVAVRYDNLRDRFSFSPERDSNSYRVMPGVEFKPRALLKGRAYVGYRKFSPLSPGVLPQFSGLVADLGLSSTILGSTSVGISFRRDLTYSYEEVQPFFIDNSPGVSIRRALGRRFDVLVSADLHQYEYRNLLIGSDATPLPRNSRIDTTWNYSGSFGYRLGRAGRIGFGASYWKRESTTARFRDYDNLRIGMTASYGS
jgi:Putative beta-barrel porin 2